MDFISESFPNQSVHISLFSISKDDDLQEITPGLVSLQQELKDDLVIVNANLIASLMHLNIGLSRGLINKRNATNAEEAKKRKFMKTNNIS